MYESEKCALSWAGRSFQYCLFFENRQTEKELYLFAFSVEHFNGLFCLRKPDVQLKLTETTSRRVKTSRESYF